MLSQRCRRRWDRRRRVRLCGLYVGVSSFGTAVEMQSRVEKEGVVIERSGISGFSVDGYLIFDVIVSFHSVDNRHASS